MKTVWATAGMAILLFLGGCATVEPPPAPHKPRAPSGPAPALSPVSIAPGTWRAAVDSWLGVPYRYGGLDRRGIDCSGFTRQIYRSVAGIDLPHNAAAQYGAGRSVARGALRPGDLVFFSEPGRGVFHVGLSLGSDQFAQASVQRGVIISSLRETYYAPRWCGTRRIIP